MQYVETEIHGVQETALSLRLEVHILRSAFENIAEGF